MRSQYLPNSDISSCHSKCKAPSYLKECHSSGSHSSRFVYTSMCLAMVFISFQITRFFKVFRSASFVIGPVMLAEQTVTKLLKAKLQIFLLFFIYIYTYLLTTRCRVLLEQLTDLQLVKKLPAFHGTRRFITALTSVRHLSLSWASPI